MTVPRRRFSLPIALAALLLVLLAPSASAQDPPPIGGDTTTGVSEAEATGSNTVTDVRVGTHDGFDRVTFEYEGDGELGWRVLYEDEPASDGSGFPIDFDGTVGLRVVLRLVPIPPDATAETFLDDVPGPAGGIINEVVNDTIYEGDHTFVVGLDEEVPYRIGRLDDPKRVVIDLVHADTTPTGPVDAGLGGTADDGSSTLPWLLGGGVLLLGAVVLIMGRRRSTT